MNTLSPFVWRPGIFVGYNLGGDTSGSYPGNRMLLINQVPASASIPLNQPYLAQGQTQVDQLCKDWSALAQDYRAARSQPQSSGAEIWLLPVADPAAGVAATHLITFVADRTYDATNGWIPGSNTTVTQTTQVDIEIGGFLPVSCRANAGDTFAQVATAAAAAYAAAVEAQPVTAAASSATLTLTDRHAGVIGEHAWIKVTIWNPSSGLRASPGTLTYAGTNGADGTLAVTAGDGSAVLSVSATLANGNTANASAVASRNALNGAAFPVQAAVAASGAVVVLYYQNDVFLGRLTATATGITTQTMTPALGTVGTGVPDLSAAVTALQAEPGPYKAISNPWQDTGGGGSWAGLSAYVIANDGIEQQKEQMLIGAFTGTLPATPSLGIPQAAGLTSYALFGVCWAQGFPVRPSELVARLCAIVASEGVANRNFNGIAIRGSASKPLPLPHRMFRPTLDQVELAIASYQLAPVTVVNEAAVLYFSRTTLAATSGPRRKYTKWGGILGLQSMRRRTREMLREKFGPNPDTGGYNLKAVGEPQTPHTASPDGVRSELAALVRVFGSEDLFDNVEAMLPQILAGVTVSPTRIDVSMPFDVVADLDQIVVMGDGR